MASLSKHIEEISSLTERKSELKFKSGDLRNSIQSLETQSPDFVGKNIFQEVENKMKLEMLRRITLETSISKLTSLKEEILSRTPDVNDHVIREELHETIAGLERMNVLLTDLSEKFDELFGSSSARQTLINQIRSETLGREVTYEELMSYKSDCEKLESAIASLDDIHEDFYIKLARIVFINISGNIKGAEMHKVTRFIKLQINKLQSYIHTKGYLLVAYILWGAMILLLTHMGRPYSGMIWKIVLITTIFISSSNYLKLVDSFKIIAEVDAKLEACSDGVEETILQKLKEEEEIKKKDLQVKADAVSRDIDKAKKDLSDFDATMEEKRNQYRDQFQKEADESSRLYQEQYDKSREVLTQCKNDLDIVSKEITEIEEKLDVLRNNIVSVAGLSTATTEKEQIMSTEMLMGFDTKTNLPLTLDVVHPAVLKGSEDEVDYMIHTMIVQLLGRMQPTKIHIYVYDPMFAGRDYVSYIHKKYEGEGVTLVRNQEAFNHLLKEFETTVVDFQFTLKTFKGIRDYNEYMVETDSVTKPYNLIILKAIPPNIERLSVYGEHYGFYWLITKEPKDDNDLEVFKSIFKTELSLPD